MTLDFNATRSAEARQFGQWLQHRGYREVWHAYDSAVRAEYAAALRHDDATMAELARVLEDPFFGVAA